MRLEAGTSFAVGHVSAGLTPNPQTAYKVGAAVTFLVLGLSGVKFPVAVLPGVLPTVIPCAVADTALIEIIREVTLHRRQSWRSRTAGPHRRRLTSRRSARRPLCLPVHRGLMSIRREFCIDAEAVRELFATVSSDTFFDRVHSDQGLAAVAVVGGGERPRRHHRPRGRHTRTSRIHPGSGPDPCHESTTVTSDKVGERR